MTLVAKIHSKTLQIAVSREDFVNLAHTGTVDMEVLDLSGIELGKCQLQVSDFTRAAMLEHVGQPYPQKWLDRSLAGRAAKKGAR